MFSTCFIFQTAVRKKSRDTLKKLTQFPSLRLAAGIQTNSTELVKSEVATRGGMAQTAATGFSTNETCTHKHAACSLAEPGGSCGLCQRAVVEHQPERRLQVGSRLALWLRVLECCLLRFAGAPHAPSVRKPHRS